MSLKFFYKPNKILLYVFSSLFKACLSSIRYPSWKKHQSINYHANYNIPTQNHYSIPVHKQNAYLKDYNIKLQITEKIWKKNISLLMHTWPIQKEFEYICEKINELKR